MIVGLIGRVVKKEATFVDLNVQNIIYRVHLSVQCSAQLSSEEIELRITQIIKEDSHNLYGFIDEMEQKIFERLLKINGVGAKVAMAICSTFSPSEFLSIVQTSNVNLLKKVVGIGPKSASRILVELGDFEIAPAMQSHVNEAVMALESLGFKKESILKVLQSCRADETSALVKEALKKIQNIKGV